MKNLNEYLNPVNEAYSGSIKDTAINYIYKKSKTYDGDYEKVKNDVIDNFIDDVADKYRMTDSQAHKLQDQLQKILASEELFKKTIAKEEEKEKTAKDAIEAKKLKKAEAVKEFVKELIDNDIKIKFDDYKLDRTYKVSINDEGDIVLSVSYN